MFDDDGEVIPDDAALHDAIAKLRTHLVYSHNGVLAGIVRRADLTWTDEVPVNFLDWRSEANHRVVIASFVAESHATMIGLGIGLYVRAQLAEISHSYRC